jgi:hypothetical protein
MSYPKAIGRTEVMVEWLDDIEKEIAHIRCNLAELVEEYHLEHGVERKDGEN